MSNPVIYGTEIIPVPKAGEEDVVFVCPRCKVSNVKKGEYSFACCKYGRRICVDKKSSCDHGNILGEAKRWCGHWWMVDRYPSTRIHNDWFLHSEYERSSMMQSLIAERNEVHRCC